MNIADNLLELANIGIAFSVFLWGVLQWYLTVRGERRKRDANLTVWGFEVMEMMAELQSISSVGRQPEKVSSTAERLAWQASALAEQGRVFFPNFHPDGSQKSFRPKLLDEVVRCSFIASYLSSHPDTKEMENLSNLTWAARKAFRAKLQEKIHLTLLHVDRTDVGDSIPVDPTSWPRHDVGIRRYVPKGQSTD